jgi:sugar lactone lactonase YvrE
MILARKMFASPLALVLSVLALSTFALAEGTRTWEQSKFDELIKGTAHGVAFRSAGGLELAPAFKSLATTPSTYIWSIASDSAGNVFVAAGAPARVYRITPDGKVATIFEPQELQVQSLVVAKNEIVYAATAPDGKVYRIARIGASESKSSSKPATSDASKDRWSASVYFDPHAKYIWDLALDDAGNLYVGTGDRGEIFKVSPNGEHSLFFKSDEVHIRVLALDSKGNLIAGSDGSGLVYRISPKGQAFVLYSAPKKEITALAIDEAGNIYAAGAGEKRTSPATPAVSVTVSSPIQNIAVGGPGILSAPSPSAGPPQSFPAPGSGATGGSEIYRIAPDGAPEHLWTSHEDLVYALGFDQHGRLIAGTGNRGHIFAINGVDDFTDLLKASASQITAFAVAPGGGIYASSSNLGKVFVLGPGLESEGSYESDVFDAHVFSRWGRASMRSAGNIELYARSGNVDNPDRNWSPWMHVDLAANSELNVPPARFVQWKTVLHGAAGAHSPASAASSHVDNVLVNYLPKNIAPQVDDITVQIGYHYQPVPHSPDAMGPGQPRFDTPPTPVRDHDSIGVRWSAHDDNDDQLVFSVYYRGDGESRWLLLKNDLADRFYSFDSSLLPDGGYTVMIVASDAPSHSPGEALYSQKVSPRFEVDNTSPVIENLNAALEGKQIRVRFRAVDSFSAIKRAEYSLDGGDWQFVEPVGQLSDSKTEDYDFRIPVPQPEELPTPIVQAVAGDHVIVVRAYDRFDNLATNKTLIRVK